MHEGERKLLGREIIPMIFGTGQLAETPVSPGTERGHPDES
jgi:hypothetical protein